MNKRIINLFFVLFLAVPAFSQTTANLKKIAPFNIKLTNGQQYTSAQLSPGPVVLIYFSPDCDHCQAFTQDMIKNYSAITNKQVIMVTFQAMDMLQPFAKKYKIAQYPNIKIGTEGLSYTVQKYYGIRSFPYIAIYDKQGNLVKTYEGEQPHAEIFKTLKKY
ncbi:TlpA family protein disulfide reductase [Dyadobacter psychrotolerans]|uniref:Redoxin domain-containing protein n=1 Tax=Dyadobacter psychrotolerans TaxID=2541721 RepID=A0A4V2Z469_9BACT|nr:thioredoxin domain-containing protein [Dyadobacter psychrotolerans]TDE15458.1 redoxin domain-containing protein [Dyadobacter psychrotolerans]